MFSLPPPRHISTLHLSSFALAVALLLRTASRKSEERPHVGNITASKAVRTHRLRVPVDYSNRTIIEPDKLFALGRGTIELSRNVGASVINWRRAFGLE